MLNNIRRILFVIYAVLFRLPTWFAIWLIGRTGVFKTVFLIYPHDKEEYARLCPDFQPFIRFMSGRPTPGGLILDGWKPIGIYLFISNPPQELMKKKNRPLVEKIITRMCWIQKLAGAKAIGLAGQLGPIFERRHNIAMEPPFFTSTMGNIFSIEEALTQLAKSERKQPWQISLGILGGGELAELLHAHFSDQGYNTTIIDVQFKRRGGAALLMNDANRALLENVDFVINLLPTGADFMKSGIIDRLPRSTSIIDFSRPAIPKVQLRQRVVMGNRVQRPGMRFAFSLPGDWAKHELPACSIPSIMAARFNVREATLSNFCRAARQLSFETALAPAAQPASSSISIKLQTLISQAMSSLRPYPPLAKESINYVLKERK